MQPTKQKRSKFLKHLLATTPVTEDNFINEIDAVPAAMGLIVWVFTQARYQLSLKGISLQVFQEDEVGKGTPGAEKICCPWETSNVLFLFLF